MRGKKGVRQRRSSKVASKIQPFSLVLSSEELYTLRKIAKKEGVPVASVVRRAIHEVIFRNYPELIRKSIKSDLDQFIRKVLRTILVSPASTKGLKALKASTLESLLG